MSVRIAVVDYGIGNLHSVVKAFRHEGAEVDVITSPEDVTRADRLVLPGVGAFADSMRALETRGLVDALKTYFRAERPFLGICVGMQVLLTESEEFGAHPGLDLVPGRVVLLRPEKDFKVPHIGWTPLQEPREGAWKGSFLATTKPGTMAYFVHSYSAAPANESDVLAFADYGGFRVTAAVRRGSAVGCQFHPEKSGPAGLAMIRVFLAA